MQSSELIRLYPRVYHMAAVGSWPSISSLGLLSTSRLVTEWEVAPEEKRSAILSQRRAESQMIESDLRGRAIIRDQKPLDPESLRSALTNMTEAEWYATLNARVFFFLQKERLAGLVNAKSYRDDEQTVLTLDTARLLQAYGNQVRLTNMNTGFAQPHSKAKRGLDTFQTVANYPHPARIQPRAAPKWDVHELTVDDAVEDIDRFIIRVERVKGGQTIEVLVEV